MDSEPMIPERDPDHARELRRPKPKPRIQKSTPLVETTTPKQDRSRFETIEMNQMPPKKFDGYNNQGFSDDSLTSEFDGLNDMAKVAEQSQRRHKKLEDDRSSATFSIDSDSESPSLKDDKKLDTPKGKERHDKELPGEPLDDEYVAITIPSEVEQELPSHSRGNYRQSSFIEKWKKGIKAFTKSSTLSSSQDEAVFKQDNYSTDVGVTSDVTDISYPKPTADRPVHVKRTPTKNRGHKAAITKFIKQNEEKYNSDELLGITIHNTDYLQMDLHILHPVVKVTLMTEDGLYIARTKVITDIVRSPRERILSPRKRTGIISDSGDKIIYPMMTQPCSFNNRSMPGFCPTWEELLLFQESFYTFTGAESKVIAFFEVMDFLPMGFETPNRLKSYHGSEPGWYKIAWGFLKFVGSDGSLNCNHKVRLQLFKPEKLSRKEMETGPSEVYCWWKLNKRSKYNSTLYITVKGISPSDNAAASIRTLLAMGKEELAEAIIQSQLQHKKAKKKKHKRNHKLNSTKKQLSEKESKTNLRQIPRWNRISGQTCKVPNKLLMSLPSSSVSSLNLNVHGNIYCLKFSPCGLKLVAGLDTEELHAILVFEFPSGNLLKSFRGHYGLIYDLDWHGESENPGEYPEIYLIASASGDCTARIWKLNDFAGDEPSGHYKTLPHPSFVYTIKFHPTQNNLVATGCFDYAIRFWDISQQGHSAHPFITLDRHYSFVNSLAFSPNGEYLFSGDGDGNVYKWKSKNPKKWTVEKNAKYSGVINNLVIHPNGKKILAHLRSNFLKLIDIETFLVLTTFNGVSNETLQIQSCISPCGNLVLSGSEDTTVCVWDSDTGKILEFINPGSHPNAIISSVSFHPYDNYMAIGLSSIISEPNPILIYGTSITASHPKIGIPTLVQMKLDFKEKQRQNEYALEQGKLDKTSQFIKQRGDSKEKFRTIIKKLDEVTKAGKLAEERNPRSMASVASKVLEKQKQSPSEASIKGPKPKPRKQQVLESELSEKDLNSV